MKLIKAVIRPNKVEDVRQALEREDMPGMTVTEVRGHGRQKGHKAIYRGREYDVSLVPKTMIELAIADHLVNEVVRTIIDAARTGDIGDGRIFVLPIEDGHNIRTGEQEG